MAALCGKMECVDQLLSDLTRDLPGWLGVVFVIVIVGAGWFGISKLYAAAGLARGAHTSDSPAASARRIAATRIRRLF